VFKWVGRLASEEMMEESVVNQMFLVLGLQQVGLSSAHLARLECSGKPSVRLWHVTR